MDTVSALAVYTSSRSSFLPFEWLSFSSSTSHLPSPAAAPTSLLPPFPLLPTLSSYGNDKVDEMDLYIKAKLTLELA